MKFWNKETEITFFKETLKNFASIEQVFYKVANTYIAYAPKGKTTPNVSIQSRNALIGQYTEKWCKDFFTPIAEELGLHAINNVVCPELGLLKRTGADLAFCTTNASFQHAQNIKIIFEIKMSIINNYTYERDKNKITFIGNYTMHKGVPSLLRSDSMLKAIGKAINIRTFSAASKSIPILILGNSPISHSYLEKVDALKKAGVVQGFISLYPKVSDTYVKETPQKGFQTFADYHSLKRFLQTLVTSDMHFLSSMLPREQLASIITLAANEPTEIGKATKFLQLLNEWPG